MSPDDRTEAGQPEQPAGNTAASEGPWTLERLKAEYPDVVAQIEAEARAEALTEARKFGKEDARAEAATAERTRILGIAGHPNAEGRWDMAVKLAGMPSMTIATAGELLAGMPKIASGPDAEFAAVMAKLKGRPAVDNQDEVSDFLARMKALDTAMLAEEHARTARRASNEQ